MGEFYCEEYLHANVTERAVWELRKLGLEHGDRFENGPFVDQPLSEVLPRLEAAKDLREKPSRRPARDFSKLV